jgi:hypothetical protein
VAVFGFPERRFQMFFGFTYPFGNDLGEINLKAV